MAGCGTRSGYLAGCRCEDCRKANSDAKKNRARAIAYGRWEPAFVDAGPSRDHLRKLAAEHRIAARQAARIAGLTDGTVLRITNGTTRRVRRETEAAILAVRPRLEQLAPLALVDATGTRRRLQALAATGRPLKRIAKHLGCAPSELRLWMRQERVTAATALKVGAVYEELWDKPYMPATEYERAARERALEYARRQMHWAPPAAWDCIDDPRERPKGLRRDGEAA